MIVLRFVVKALCYLLLITIITFTFLVYFALQAGPHIQQAHFINSQTAAQNKQLLDRLKWTFKHPQQNALISLSNKELQGLSALAHRALPKLSSHTHLLASEANISLSYQLPLPDPIKYLNISSALYSSKMGLVLSDVKIGSITFSGRRILAVIRWSINTFIQENLGNQLFTSIKSVKVTPNSLAFALALPKNLPELVDNKKILANLGQQFALFGNKPKISNYFQKLVQFSEQQTTSKSLLPYLQFSFQQAQQQWQALGKQNAALENRAALAALALYFGSDKFALFIGDLGPQTLIQKQQQQLLRAKTTLHNRVDLQKHFIYSIALQLLSSSKASDAIGELKELLDSNKGGSGFSFADLLADRAGTRLANLASQPISAINTMKQLANIDAENKLIPAITDLPEGISSQNFDKNYGDINSDKYRHMVELIDHKLMQLPLYQTVN